MNIGRLIIAFGTTLSLVSCATITPEQPTPQNKKITWDSRVKTLSSVKSWDLKGIIAIRSTKDSGSASIQWHQYGHNYHIGLFGPLGANSFELTGQPGKVELASANGKRSTASSAEELLAQQAGWRLPVSNLYYWIRGLPVPNVPAQKSLDNYNHLIQMQQQGWTIRYLGYTSIQNIDMPSKIFLDNPQLNVKIIIKDWKI